MSELYSGTESAVRCGGTMSDLFPVVTGVLQGVCTGHHTSQHLYGLDSGEDVRETSCSALFGNVKISDLDFADDAVIFAETGYPFVGPQGDE